jgi:Cys-tRNA(Pro)/Cys-tRNA(Cys) deacylase
MSDFSLDSTPVTRALEAAHIPFRFFRHPGEVQSLEQAAHERGQLPEQVVRSIVFRLAPDDFIMVLVAGPSQLSWPRLRSFLGASRMTMATPGEVMIATGYPLGAVSPFGLPLPMRTLVDRRVFDHAEISIGSGLRHTTIIMRSDDLRRALGSFESGDFLFHQSP